MFFFRKSLNRINHSKFQYMLRYPVVYDMNTFNLMGLFLQTFALNAKHDIDAFILIVYTFITISY